MPTVSEYGEGNMKGGAKRERPFDTAESETLSMWGNSIRENREAPQTPTGIALWAGRRRREAVMSTCTFAGSRTASQYQRRGRTKLARRGVGSGVRRGKEADQGERTTDDLAPDTEPGKRVTGIVARTESTEKG